MPIARPLMVLPPSERYLTGSARAVRFRIAGDDGSCVKPKSAQLEHFPKHFPINLLNDVVIGWSGDDEIAWPGGVTSGTTRRVSSSTAHLCSRGAAPGTFPRKKNGL